MVQVAGCRVGTLWLGLLGIYWPTSERGLDRLPAGGPTERAVRVLGDTAQAGPQLE